MPPPPSSSIVTVSSLWFLSIMFSLAATTWAVLSLEWCAFLTADVRSEDYEETAEKKQRNYEAIKDWKMHLIVASIPFFLHISIFLFLAGLWLRLRDVNRQLELLVGISSLVIALSYVIVTLLPTFKDAPFHTSVSEVINALVKEIRYRFKLRRFVRPPPILTWISNPLASMSRKCSPYLRPLYRLPLYLLRHVAAALLIRLLQWIYRFTSSPAHAMWTVPKGVLWAISPAFPPGGDPLRELSRLQTGPSDQNGGVRQRALFRLMNTHLTQPEVTDVLKEWKELRGSGNVEEHLDRTMVKLLVSSLSSVLWDGKITPRERPIFDHCTRLLTEEMGRVFHDAKYDAKVLVWKPTAIPRRLRKFVDFKPPAQIPLTSKSSYNDYWDKVVRLLWLSPSERRIKTVIKRVEVHMRSTRPALLQRIVRGLHAATLSSLMADKQQSIISFPLPDFNRWESLDGGLNDDGFEDDGFEDDGLGDGESSDDESVDGGLNHVGPNNDESDDDGSNDDDRLAKERLDLYREVSAFLQNILAKFYETTSTDDQDLQSPTTIPELVVALESLNEQGKVPPNFQSALRLLITTTWRSNPSVFNTDPSVAPVLVTSVNDFIAKSTPGTPGHSKGIAIRLHTITHGPHAPSNSIANLYCGPVKDDSVCLSKFIHVTAAVLEAVLAKENPLGVSELRSHIDSRAVQATVFTSFFTDGVAFDYSLQNPDYRLPYLYSLAITLSHGVEVTVQHPLEVFHLLRALATERLSDTKAGIEGTSGTDTTTEKRSDIGAVIEEKSDTGAVIEEAPGTDVTTEKKPDTGAVTEKSETNAANKGTPDTNASTKKTLGTDTAIDRMLDTNILVVNVVKRTISRRAGPAFTAADVRTYLDPITQALQPLQAIIKDRRAYHWRTRWKAIYLLVDIISILPRPLAGLDALQSLINRTIEAARSYLDENAPVRRRLMKKDDSTPRKRMTELAPHDWRVKRDGLRICGLEDAVKELARWKEPAEGVYSWREPENIPYLSLYPQRTRYDPTSRSYWLLERLQR